MNLEQIIEKGQISLWDAFLNLGVFGVVIDVLFIIVAFLLYMRASAKDQEDQMIRDINYSLSYCIKNPNSKRSFIERGSAIAQICILASIPLGLLFFSKEALIDEWKKEYVNPYIYHLPTETSMVNVLRDENTYAVSVRDKKGKIIENQYAKDEFHLYDTHKPSYATFKALQQDLGNGVTPGVYNVNVHLNNLNEIKDTELK